MHLETAYFRTFWLKLIFLEAAIASAWSVRFSCILVSRSVIDGDRGMPVPQIMTGVRDPDYSARDGRMLVFPVPQIHKQIVEVRFAFHWSGISSIAGQIVVYLYHKIMVKLEVIQLVRTAVVQIVAFSATDYGENVEVIQLVHFYCGAGRGRANATDHEDLRC